MFLSLGSTRQRNLKPKRDHADFVKACRMCPQLRKRKHFLLLICSLFGSETRRPPRTTSPVTILNLTSSVFLNSVLCLFFFFFFLFCRCTLNACAATVQRLFLELMVVKIKSRMKFLFSPRPLLFFVDVCVLVIVLVCNACFCFLPWVLLSNHTFLKQRELLACRMDGWNSNAGIKKKKKMCGWGSLLYVCLFLRL